MSPIQINNRLLSILPFGKRTVIVLKSNSSYYHYGQYIKHIRWFYSSSMLFNEQSNAEKAANLLENVGVNGRNAKHMLLSPKRTSIVPIVHSNTSFTTTSSSTQTISKSKLIWQRIIHELKHYYNGFKLLFIETKTAFHLLHRILNGYTLTRRERKQFTRTVVDLFRLVPFSVFIIVPFMEFTLPIFLKLFPNMLPSTFKQIDKEQENLKKQSRIKLEITKFLQDTLEDIIFKSRERCLNDVLTIQIDIQPSIEGIMKFSSLFGNQLTLDNFARPQLIALCKLLNLSFIGPNSYLRFKLHLKFYRLKLDDQLIANEGIQNLNIEELQAACHERGINSLDIRIEHLQSNLQQWLDLHINKCIPISILLLSHVFYLPKNICNATVAEVNDQHVHNTESIQREVMENQVIVPQTEFVMSGTIQTFNRHTIG